MALFWRRHFIKVDKRPHLRYIVTEVQTMLWLYIVLSAAALVAIALSAVTVGCYIKVFYQRHHKTENHFRLPDSPHFERGKDKMYALITEMAAVPFERVYTVANDGVRLSARYYHIADGAPLQIQVPGYRGTSVRDFCGGNKLARKCGFNTLLVDLRAHGESGGHTITFGVRECQDVLCWIRFAQEKWGDIDIWLVGVSMGASTVLMASDKLQQFGSSVRGIVADCPYARGEDIIADSCRKMGLPPKIMMPFIRAGARLFGRFRLRDADVIKAVSHTQTPILLLHGEQDDIVPCEMSKVIFDHCGGYKERLVFPEAGHGLSYLTDNQRYEAAIKDFVERTSSH